MVPTVAVVRPDVIIEVPRDATIVAAVTINMGGAVRVVPVASADRASVVVAIAVVAWVVARRSPEVI